MAMAYRAGATLANMEFVQFHPTCLFHPQAKIVSDQRSDARRRGSCCARGLRRGLHGALPRAEGSRAARHRRARDRFGRTQADSGDECVLPRHQHTEDAGYLRERFPTIYHATCLHFGVDITRRVPFPSSRLPHHYWCGGVRTERLDGETDLPNLFAAGEVACTGPPRRQSPRLELTPRSARLRRRGRAPRRSRSAERHRPFDPIAGCPPGKTGRRDRESTKPSLITQNWDEIRRFMWNYVGIVRSNKPAGAGAARASISCSQEITGVLLELRSWCRTWSSCATSPPWLSS